MGVLVIVKETYLYLFQLTDTKKLEVPSVRANVFGNSLSHVSSPYIVSRPLLFLPICASHVSCDARVDDVSDSAMLRIMSRNEGIDPVVKALTLGIVTVGA